MEEEVKVEELKEEKGEMGRGKSRHWSKGNVRLNVRLNVKLKLHMRLDMMLKKRVDWLLLVLLLLVLLLLSYPGPPPFALP